MMCLLANSPNELMVTEMIGSHVVLTGKPSPNELMVTEMIGSHVVLTGKPSPNVFMVTDNSWFS